MKSIVCFKQLNNKSKTSVIAPHTVLELEWVDSTHRKLHPTNVGTAVSPVAISACLHRHTREIEPSTQTTAWSITTPRMGGGTYGIFADVSARDLQKSDQTERRYAHLSAELQCSLLGGRPLLFLFWHLLTALRWSES